MINRLIFLGVLILIFGRSYSQTLQEIVNKRNQIQSIHQKKIDLNTVYMDLVILTPKGEEIPAKLSIKNRIGYKLELLTKTGKNFESINKEGYYVYSEKDKSKDIKDPQTTTYQSKKSLMIIDELKNSLDPSGAPFPLEHMGQMDVDGTPCYAYRSRTENNEVYSELYIDITNLQVIKKVMFFPAPDGSPAEETILYKNFIKDKEGNFYPSEFNTKFGLAKVKSYKKNVPLDDKIFHSTF